MLVLSLAAPVSLYNAPLVLLLAQSTAFAFEQAME